MLAPQKGTCAMSLENRNVRTSEAVAGLGEEVRSRILEHTREVVANALSRLRGLSSQLPAGVLEQVERLHSDPAHERRKAARLEDSSAPVAVQAPGLPEADNTSL